MSAVLLCSILSLSRILILIIIFSSLPYFRVLDTIYGCSLVSGGFLSGVSLVVPIPWVTSFSLRLPSPRLTPEGAYFPTVARTLALLPVRGILHKSLQQLYMAIGIVATTSLAVSSLS
jgi:hypothetical protein